jgi:hypothetical protein
LPRQGAENKQNISLDNSFKEGYQFGKNIKEYVAKKNHDLMKYFKKIRIFKVLLLPIIKRSF